MNKTTLLRTLLVIDVLLTFTALGADLFFGWTLPPGLAAFARNRAGMPGGSNLPHIALLLVSTVCAFTSWIGLALLRPFARPLYVAAWALFLVFVIVRGPAVSTSVGAMVRLLHAIVACMVIGLVYFSDLAREFEARAAAPIGLRADRA